LYAVHWPYYQFETSRNKIKSPLYGQLEKEGACFGEAAGWERQNWYTNNGQRPQYQYSYHKQNWFENVRSECIAVRNDIGLFELTSFSKFIIRGDDVVNFLNYMCVSEMNVPIGRIIYTQMLGEIAA
jgi:glycine cleavage system aminomethyltransferase T